MPKLDPDAYPEQPAGLTLEQVHVYVRHGERTPVRTIMNSHPAYIPEHWPLCKRERKLSTIPPSPDIGHGNAHSPGGIDVERVVESRNGDLTSGICMMGELTDIGHQSTHDFGKALRKIYIERLGFLPDSTQSTSPAYFRSTNVPRTIESLQQIINGLYPKGKNLHRPRLVVRYVPSSLNHSESHTRQPFVATIGEYGGRRKSPPHATERWTSGEVDTFLRRKYRSNAKDEIIAPNHIGCRRLERLNASFGKAVAEGLNSTLKPLDQHLSKYLGGEPVRVDGKPKASGILDTIRAAKAHNIQLPGEFNDQRTVDLLESAVVTEWFGGYENPEYRKLAIGPLLEDLQKKMQRKVEKRDQDPLKLLVYSTHDTAIVGITNAFDVFDRRWPDFTASVTFELFKQPPQLVKQAKLFGFPSPMNMNPSASRPSHYVRMRYQNKSLPLPACAKPGDHLPGHPELCTLQAFQRHVKGLTPEDWEKECTPQPPPVKSS
ncbi:SubName: Full=Related to acid phosphatase ACP2 {ECO:0000313/EMBL:CCA68201.1} [Serendipita indica DSM 11827]|nr:SubName: Full=Related to acid phosphatase ACP2 {ECO:0000313/EMBL:CCA68201.1} [Serendipita indica DSM 11827]